VRSRNVLVEKVTLEIDVSNRFANNHVLIREDVLDQIDVLARMDTLEKDARKITVWDRASQRSKTTCAATNFPVSNARDRRAVRPSVQRGVSHVNDVQRNATASEASTRIPPRRNVATSTSVVVFPTFVRWERASTRRAVIGASVEPDVFTIQSNSNAQIGTSAHQVKMFVNLVNASISTVRSNVNVMKVQLLSKVENVASNRLSVGSVS
jgi:hypothetical protein